MVSYEHDRHEFLFNDWTEDDPRAEKIDFVDVACKVRDFIEDLRPTTATFVRKQITEEYDEIKHGWLREDILYLCGAWRVPDYYDLSDGRGQRWVNPGYAHKSKYSDVSAKCRCGVVIQNLPASSPASQFMESKCHNGHCRVEWRARAIADLYEARRTVLRRNGLLNRSSRQEYERFHLERPRKVVYAVQSLDMDLQALRDRGREKRMNTICDLLREGHATDRIGRVYDISAATVRSHIAQRTDHTITGLRAES